MTENCLFPKVVILLVCLVHNSISSYDSPETPRDMIVGNGYIYLLSSNTLYQLHRNLTIQSQITLVSGRFNAEPLKMILSENETEIVVCYSNGQCIVYDAEYLFIFGQPLSVSSFTSEEIAMVRLTSQTMYTASEGIHGTSRVIRLAQYTLNYDEIHLEHSRILTVTNSTFSTRTFFDAFQSDKYVYFIALDSVDTPSSSTKSITAMRVCHDEAGFSGIYEIALSCGHDIGLDATINTVSLDRGNNVLLIGLSSVNHSMLCSFAVSDINQRLTCTFDECNAGIHRIPLPWAGYEEFDCTKFSGVS